MSKKVETSQHSVSSRASFHYAFTIKLLIVGYLMVNQNLAGMWIGPSILTHFIITWTHSFWVHFIPTFFKGNIDGISVKVVAIDCNAQCPIKRNWVYQLKKFQTFCFFVNCKGRVAPGLQSRSYGNRSVCISE